MNEILIEVISTILFNKNQNRMHQYRVDQIRQKISIRKSLLRGGMNLKDFYTACSNKLIPVVEQFFR